MPGNHYLPVMGKLLTLEHKVTGQLISLIVHHLLSPGWEVKSQLGLIYHYQEHSNLLQVMTKTVGWMFKKNEVSPLQEFLQVWQSEYNGRMTSLPCHIH